MNEVSCAFIWFSLRLTKVIEMQQHERRHVQVMRSTFQEVTCFVKIFVKTRHHQVEQDDSRKIKTITWGQECLGPLTCKQVRLGMGHTETPAPSANQHDRGIDMPAIEARD